MQNFDLWGGKWDHHEPENHTLHAYGVRNKHFPDMFQRSTLKGRGYFTNEKDGGGGGGILAIYLGS